MVCFLEEEVFFLIIFGIIYFLVLSRVKFYCLGMFILFGKVNLRERKLGIVFIEEKVEE